MPEKILPNAEAFGKFETAMLAKGFRKIGSEESRKDFERLGLMAPRPRQGREVGFVFVANNLQVRVWTTYLESEGEAREEDAGWVLILEGDAPQYFSHPIHRTRNFLGRLYKWAQVAQQRVHRRPLCPTCQAYMRIAYGPALKSRYWECARASQHPDRKNRRTSWDIGLTPKALAFVFKERKRRDAYKVRAGLQGKKPGTAMLRRKAWSATRPQNLV